MAFTTKRIAAGATVVRAALLFVWFLASFGVAFFARDLNQVVAGWPLNFWLAAQGGVLVFIAVVMAYAWFMNRLDAAAEAQTGPPALPDDEAPADG